MYTLISPWLSAQAVFLTAGLLVLFTAAMAFVVLREPDHFATQEQSVVCACKAVR